MPHVHEKIDFTTQAFIVHEGKVLLRMHDKYNIWLPPGGHIELEHDPIETIHKEVREETGLEIELIGKEFVQEFRNGVNNLLPPLFMNRMEVKPGHEHVDLIYAAKAVTTQIHPDPSEKPVDFKWFTKEELEDPAADLQDHIRFYALEVLKLARI